MKKKGFIISTTLYSIFGIMFITIFSILYVLSTNRTISNSTIDIIKDEIIGKKNIYLNLLGTESSLNNITTNDIEQLKKDLLKKKINLVVDKSISGTDTEKIEATERNQSTIATKMYEKNTDYYYTYKSKGKQKTLIHGDTIINVVNDSGNSEDYSRNQIFFQFYSISKNKIVSKTIYSAKYDDNNIKFYYNDNKSEFCVLYTAYNKSRREIYDSSSYAIKSSEYSSSCDSGFNLINEDDTYIDSGVENYFATSANGGLVVKNLGNNKIQIEYARGKVTLGVNTKNEFEIKPCLYNTSNRNLNHICIYHYNSGGKYYKIENSTTSTLTSKTYSTSCKSGYNTTCSYSKTGAGMAGYAFSLDLEQLHPIPEISTMHLSESSTSDAKRFFIGDSTYGYNYQHDDCINGNDLCLNTIDDMEFNDAFLGGGITFNKANAASGSYSFIFKFYNHILKHNNKYGVILNVTRRFFHDTKYNESDEDEYNFFILWFDELTEENIFGKYTNRLFKLNSDEKNAENTSSYDKEYYVFETDLNADSNGVSRLKLDDDVLNSINKNNSTSVLFSTDNNLKSTFPAPIDNFYKEKITIKRLKEIILNDFSKNNNDVQQTIKYTDNSGANPPELASGMIPVIYDNTKKAWVKANLNDKWYDYNSGMWANAVTVTSASREKYMSAAAKTTISINDINSMWVWIPRYKYRIQFQTVGVKYARGANNYNVSPSNIDIVFENGTSSTGSNFYTEIDDYFDRNISKIAISEFYTHPAFRDGSKIYNKTAYDLSGWDHELTGIWVGKFETGGSSSEPIIKPNITALSGQSVEKQIESALKFSNGTPVISSSSYGASFAVNSNNIYGINTTNTKVDTHMMKNTEWGAVAYLSQSRYGKGNNSETGSEVYPNTSKTGQTYGKSSCDVFFADTPSQYAYNGCGVDINNNKKTIYNYNDNNGLSSSTTGTVYGVYDMNGGYPERIMGATNNYLSGKYFDNYSKSCSSSKCSIYSGYIMGDATWETRNWYRAGYLENIGQTKWIKRGAEDTSPDIIFDYKTGKMIIKAGIFSYFEDADSGDTGFRTTLIAN